MIQLIIANIVQLWQMVKFLRVKVCLATIKANGYAQNKLIMSYVTSKIVYLKHKHSSWGNTMKVTRLIFITLMLLIPATLIAQSGGDFVIKKSSIDAGGGRSEGGNFKLDGTIGQVDASELITGGNYSLSGGLWNAKPVIKEDMMFKDSFEN